MHLERARGNATFIEIPRAEFCVSATEDHTLGTRLKLAVSLSEHETQLNTDTTLVFLVCDPRCHGKVT